MNSSQTEVWAARATSVVIDGVALTVELVDGRTVSVPLGWYPRLSHGTEEERRNWRLIGGGEGIHWPELDDDISVDDLLQGRRSAEGQASLARWLAGRRDAG